MIIIGITGTIGAGKGTVVDYLVNSLKYKHYSVRQYLNNELAKKGIEQDRDSQRELANKIRGEKGNFFIIGELLKDAKKTGKNCVIESIRNPGEVEFLKNNGGILLAVDADQKLRYERIKLRASETDQVSFEEFINQEKKELENTDPSSQNLKRCIEMADVKLYNNGTIENLYENLKEELEKITG